MSETIRFTLNGRPVVLDTEADRSLLWVLRTDLESTGTKYGCGVGLCGSCTVVVDGRAARSCQMDLASVRGKEVTTIEGLARDGRLHPLQQAFHEHGGFQCGYCTPGMIMAANALINNESDPDENSIRKNLSNNLCRCTGYDRPVKAVLKAAQDMKADRNA